MGTTSIWRHIIMGGLTITLLAPNARAAHMPITRQTKTISWFDCPDSATTQCAFFDVPMDYSDPSSNATVSIFMRKFPATVPADQRLGTILVNTGGPGGSASSWAATAAKSLSTQVEGRYDILGFDPRRATAQWGKSDWPIKWLLRLRGKAPTPNPSVAAVSAVYHFHAPVGAPFPHIGGNAGMEHVKKIAAVQGIYPTACSKRGNKQALQHMGTVDVAEDMANIVDALGEDGLNFLGYSYGTILGATFAALYPDKVKRMVLDGVSDAEAYFAGPLEWGRASLVDTHKTFHGFFSTCIEAGPEKCAFAKPINGSQQVQTIESLSERLDAIYSKLRREPLTVDDSLAGPGVAKASDLQALLFALSYAPRFWSGLTTLLVQLEMGQGADLYGALYAPYYEIQPKSYHENVYNRSMQIYSTRESLLSIFCSETSPLDISIDAYSDYFRELGNLSAIGEQWALIMGACRGWPFRAKRRYTGPWTTADGLKKTRFPILFVSLDADPVTPLASAVKMSRAFGNESASLLVQHGYGHCSIAHPSLCTVKHIRDYFVDGAVPANGTTCDSEPGFIYPSGNGTNTKRTTIQRSRRDEELLDAVQTMHDARRRVVPYL